MNKTRTPAPQTQPLKALGPQNIIKGPNSEPGPRKQHPESPHGTDPTIDTHTHKAETTATEREKALPNCNYAHNDKTQGRARALTHPISDVAIRKDNGLNHHHQKHTTLTPPTYTYTRTTASTRGTYQWHPTEGNNSEDPPSPPDPATLQRHTYIPKRL